MTVLLEIFSNPVWQGIGVIVTLLLGLIAFYYAGKQKLWIFITGITVTLLVGSALGAEIQRTYNPAKKMALNVADQNFSIESVPFTVFVYSDNGSGVLSVIRNANIGTDYKLEYSLPNAGNGYVGIAFQFEQFLDWTSYEYVEVTLTFEDEQTRYDLGVRDKNQKVYVSLDGNVNSSGVAVTWVGRRQTVRIPLATNFKSINRKVIDEITFSVDTKFTSGKHVFTVNSVKLIKP